MYNTHSSRRETNTRTSSPALERTFLAYIRTSVVFSIQGVLIAQLFRLQNTLPSTRFDFYTVGIPLSVAFQGCALVVAIIGAIRFWRQQHAIATGKVYAGGWEMNCIGWLAMIVSPLTLSSYQGRKGEKELTKTSLCLGHINIICISNCHHCRN
jgi:uncharacterized membrane protein YidH (DUF202 family)